MPEALSIDVVLLGKQCASTFILPVTIEGFLFMLQFAAKNILFQFPIRTNNVYNYVTY